MITKTILVTKSKFSLIKNKTLKKNYMRAVTNETRSKEELPKELEMILNYQNQTHLIQVWVAK